MGSGSGFSRASAWRLKPATPPKHLDLAVGAWRWPICLPMRAHPPSRVLPPAQIELLEPEILVRHLELQLGDPRIRPQHELGSPTREPRKLVPPCHHERIELQVRQIRHELRIRQQAQYE